MEPPAESREHDRAATPPEAPPEAVAYLGPQLAPMEDYVARLSDTGVKHGLIGPREVPRLWERHVLNCAVVQELIEPDTQVIDVGSGAGLPGLVLAIARPDLRVTLVEPLLRRVTWLEAVIAEMKLTNIDVVRSRAEDQAGILRADVVTSRAVAALDKLAGWSLPLVADGGRMLALKGSSAAEELGSVEDDLASWGVAQASIHECGTDVVDPATIVTALTLETPPVPGSLARPKKPGGSRAAKKTNAKTNAGSARDRRSTRRSRRQGR